MNIVVRASFVVLLINSFMLVQTFRHPPASLRGYDVFSQRNFPCQEDEVLSYAQRFGPDRVGCINYDDLLTSYTTDWEVK